MRLWLVAGVAALGGLAAEVAAMHAGVPPGSAALDLVAGWVLLVAAAAGRSLTTGCRLMAGAAGVLWFVGTLQPVDGEAGRVGELWGSLYVAPLAAALLGAPAARPPRPGQRAMVTWLWLRGAVPALAAWNVATLASGGGLAVAGERSARGPRDAPARHAAVALGVALFVAAAMRLLGADGAWIQDLLAVVVTGCPRERAFRSGARRRVPLSPAVTLRTVAFTLAVWIGRVMSGLEERVRPAAS